MASTVLAAAAFTLSPGPSRVCPDADLSFLALILSASSDMRYPRRSLAAARLQSLRRPQGSQGFELRSMGGAAPLVSMSSKPP
jgi:hypothetical protein